MRRPSRSPPGPLRSLLRLGGSVPPAGLWNQVAGMQQEKRLIERRVVLPLAHPELAQDHGVEPPRAAVLFGPPGTGKTSFARAVASRLAWPFVELFPSRLAGGEGGLPRESATPSRGWPNWTMWWCSSTRWRKSRPPAAADR